MGGSFGGYMANWVAGHTDRFKAIITHASLWELRGFHGTTDDGVELGAGVGRPVRRSRRMYENHSPHEAVGDIKTPMLVIHGELDARVPISEALRLWTDLHRHDVEAKFLYFPDENHWVLKPQNARIWYETVLAFLDQLRARRRVATSGAALAHRSGYHRRHERRRSPAMTDLAGDATVAVAQAAAAAGSAPALDAAPGIIATEDERYNATLVRRVDQHESLAYFWVRFDGEPTPFEPGPVHDDRRVRRRQDRAAAVLGRLGAARGRRHRLRVLPAARPGRHVHADPVGPAGRPPDADDRPEGQVPARARRRPDPPVHLVRARATPRSSR